MRATTVEPAAREAPGGRAPGTIAITGASGLVGRYLCDHFRRRGWEVRGLVRGTSGYPFEEAGISLFRCDLPDVLEDASFRGADVVIHCAYATRFTGLDASRRVNEDGTRRVLAAARGAGVRRFVFISSTSAHRDAPSYYGRSKHALELLMDPGSDLVIRPGLVLASDGGLFHRIRALVRRTPVVPLPGSGTQVVQTVHIDDLCTAVERALTREFAGALNVAEPDGCTMKELVRQIARLDGSRRYLLPVPIAPLYHCFRLLERLQVPFPASSENLLGLTSLRTVPVTADLDRLGMKVRPAAESLAALT
jgi:nucleoside-diphosphate-sugar epimerase